MIDRVMDRRGLDNFDLRFLGLIFVILGIGVLSIYSVTHDQGGPGLPFYAKQIVWILLGIVAFLVMLVWDYHRIARLAYPAYAIILILLAVVLFEGKTSRGAQRWIPIGPFAFQPSEFAKLVLILVMAHYYSKAPRVGWLQRVVIPGALMLPGLLLILKQPDLGSGLSFMAVYAAMLLMVGMRSQALGVILLFSLMLFPFAWMVLGSLQSFSGRVFSLDRWGGHVRAGTLRIMNLFYNKHPQPTSIGRRVFFSTSWGRSSGVSQVAEVAQAISL